MRPIIFCTFMLASTLSFAAIARTGTCAAATTACTFTATAAGDLKLIFSYNSSSGTIPTLAAGWSAVTSGVQTATAIRVGCNISSSSGDTGSGTWTNATNVVGLSYSGTNGISSTTCGQRGVSNTGFNSATSSTSVDFYMLTLKGQTGTSWVVGFAGDSAALPAAPTGMTQETSSGTGPAAAANDTNGTVSSWSSTNVVVASSTWLTLTVQIEPLIPCKNSLALMGAGCN